MGRGKIEIKKIENSTNRQVTYSKRRAGLIKKAEELTVLCDAQINLILISGSRKVHHYCSPSTDIHTVMDRYQQLTDSDLWQPQYEGMQKTLNHLKETNNNLRKQIRQRMGEDLEDLNMNELLALEREMDESITVVRDKKYHVLTTRTDTAKKKWKNGQQRYNSLVQDLVKLEGVEILDYACASIEASDYKPPIAMSIASRPADVGYAFHHSAGQSNVHDVGYGFHELRLA
uniref:MADS box transcription factor AP3 n=1 Tax=Sagittaria montevidensis TaxID=118780 RepID=Q9LLA0_SAGMO|nr:MADS box transcription factor AP3 [Sagittaria montevidensis]